MNKQSMDEGEFQQLDKLIAGLPRSISPGHDLWPEIETSIAGPAHQGARQWHWWNSPLVSAASLAVAASALTFALTRAPEIAQPSPAVVSTQPASVMLDPGFLANRKRLENQIDGRLSELSPEMRGLVRQNLATIRGSLHEISMALAEDPDNADLHDLLLSTYEQELQVMTEINRMPDASARRIEL